MSFAASAVLLAWVGLAMLTLVVLGLARQVAFLSEQVRRQPVLPAKPALPVASVNAGSLSLEVGRANLFILVEANCRTCERLLPELVAIADDTDEVRIVVATRTPTSLPVFRATKIETAAHPMLFAELGVTTTPFAVLLDGGGRVVASDVVGSADAVERLIAEGALPERTVQQVSTVSQEAMHE